MSTAIAETTTTAVQAAPQLPEAVVRRGIDEAQWRTLMNSLFPGAKAESVLMVVDYCRARKLDPLKKPCHIVPMKVKQGDDYVWRDVVLPGIYEYRTTAVRTGLYLGHTAPVYGEMREWAGVEAPEWCAMTFKRLGPNGMVIEFPVTVYFREVCNTKDEWIDKKRTGRVIANDRWSKAPIQMLTKTCEAAGLREAFPDEFGGEMTAEEMDGREPAEPATAAPTIKPAQRLSQQQPATTEAAATVVDAVIESESPASAAPSMAPTGCVVDVVDKSQGAHLAAIVVLDTGFKASTRSGEIIGLANNLKGTGQRVEIVSTPSTKDPSKFAPTITELVKVEGGESQS